MVLKFYSSLTLKHYNHTSFELNLNDKKWFVSWNGFCIFVKLLKSTTVSQWVGIDPNL